jgi:putative glutamate/gamma-aminobutyrate antiporter
MEKQAAGPRVLGPITFSLMTVAALFSLSGLTNNAEYGFSSVFFYLVPALVFFIPAALVSAMLATGWPSGGIFTWVSAAFGRRWGFLAIWLQWFQSLTLYMTILSFSAAALAFAFNPSLSTNSIFVLSIILIIYWGSTLLNLRGVKLSSKASSLGVVFGTLLPGAFLILLAGLWLMGGNTPETSLAPEAMLPDLSNPDSYVLALGGILLFAGIEMTASHIRELKEPLKNYPRAIFLAAGIAFVIFILGTLSIAITVPQPEISLVAGIMEAFTALLSSFGILWLLPFIMALIVLGTLAQVITWIGGPSKGMLDAAKKGCLPPLFQRVNQFNIPAPILLLQGIIVTILSQVFIMMPDISSSFWILTALTAQIYLVMYAIMFASALKLRYSQPGVKPSFRIPGGSIGLWIVAGAGFLASLAGILLGFFPPVQEQTGGLGFYELFLAAGILAAISVPLLFYHFRKKSWAAP